MKEMINTSNEIKAAAAISSTTAVSSTTLQDLPIEILDYILMKAVVKKVMEKKLAKSAWVEYTSQVIWPLRAVSLQWDYRLTTNWFKIVLCRNLMRKDPVPISVETIAHTWSDFGFGKFGRLYNQAYFVDPCDEKGDDSEECFLQVFEVQDLTHPIKKIPLPSLNAFNHEGGMATCKCSNSLYVWQSFPTTWPEHPDIWRIVPNGDGGFEVLEWPIYYDPSDDFLDVSAVSSIGVDDLSVLDDGNLLVLRNVYGYDKTKEEVDNILSIHKPDGSIIRNMTLLYDTRLSNVTMKSNGNFVYAQVLDCLYNILETDKDGKGFRNFRFDRDADAEVTIGCKQLFLDSCDRVIFHDGSYKLIFLDCELNLLGEIEILQMKLEYGLVDDYDDDDDNDNDYTLYHAHFDKDTNEMIVMYSIDEVLLLKLTL